MKNQSTGKARKSQTAKPAVPSCVCQCCCCCCCDGVCGPGCCQPARKARD